MSVLFKYKQARGSRGDTLIIVFQSMNSYLYMPENLHKFELEKSFGRDFLNVDLLFIKDPSPHLFYLDYFDDIKNILTSLSSGYSKVVCTGISAGGWASCLFGSIINASLVVAVNPMTSLCDLSGHPDNLVIQHNPATRFFFDSCRIESTFLDIVPFVSPLTTYYINGHSHGVDYADMTVVEKLHDIRDFERMQIFPNVGWLSMGVPGYKDGSFVNLLRQNSIPVLTKDI